MLGANNAEREAFEQGRIDNALLMMQKRFAEFYAGLEIIDGELVGPEDLKKKGEDRLMSFAMGMHTPIITNINIRQQFVHRLMECFESNSHETVSEYLWSRGEDWGMRLDIGDISDILISIFAEGLAHLAKHNPTLNDQDSKAIAEDIIDTEVVLSNDSLVKNDRDIDKEIAELQELQAKLNNAGKQKRKRKDKVGKGFQTA